jgi:hypothetical protein
MSGMGTSGRTWHDYIWKMRPAHMGLIFIIISAIPLAGLLQVPIPTTFMSQDYFNTVNAAAARATAQGRRPVMVRGECYYIVAPGFNDGEASQLALSQKLKYEVLWVILDTTAQINFLNYMRRYKFAYQIPGEAVLGGPMVYGVDWVMIGPILGEEPAMARVAADIWTSVNNKDYFGTSLSDLPMMATLHSFADVDVTRMVTYSGTASEMFVRQWTSAAYPNLMAVGNFAYADVAYAYGKYVLGTLSTSQTYAELEQLMDFKGYFGRPGEEQAMAEGRNTQGVFMLACIALGAIHLRIEKRTRIKEEVKT